MSFWKWFRTKFHSHEWEVRHELPLKIHGTRYVESQEPTVVAQGVRYVLQCKVCGEIKYKDCI